MRCLRNYTINVFILILWGCGPAGVHNSQNLTDLFSLQLTQDPSGTVYTGDHLTTPPVYGLYTSGRLNQLSSDFEVKLSAYSEASCTTPSLYTIDATENPLPLTSGLAAFDGVSYSLTGGLEESIYLEASAQGVAPTCNAIPVKVLHKFRTGFGFTLTGTTGTAGATGANTYDWMSEVKIDSQGRYIVVGNSKDAAGGTQMALWRYLPDGSLDTSFGGGNGYVLGGSPGAAGATGASLYDIAATLRLDPTGMIIVSGQSKNLGGGTELVLWRYHPNGTIDTSFGSGGHVSFGPIGASGSTGSSVNDWGHLWIDSKGRYVLGGNTFKNGGGWKMAIWRYNPDGTLDTTFNGGAGYKSAATPGFTGTTGSAQRDGFLSLEIDSSDRLILSGYSYNGSGLGQLILWRLLDDGSDDTTFGGGSGFVTPGAFNVGGGTYGDYGVLHIDSQGRYVIGGESSEPGKNIFAIYRFNSDGSADTTFGGGNGYIIRPLGLNPNTAGSTTNGEYSNDFKIDSKGRYILGGYSGNSSGGCEVVLWRYLSDGSIDTSFGGGNGYVTTGSIGAAGATGASACDWLSSIELDDVGRILVVGNSVNPAGGAEGLIRRFKEDGTLDD